MGARCGCGREGDGLATTAAQGTGGPRSGTGSTALRFPRIRPTRGTTGVSLAEDQACGVAQPECQVPASNHACQAHGSGEEVPYSIASNGTSFVSERSTLEIWYRSLLVNGPSWRRAP